MPNVAPARMINNGGRSSSPAESSSTGTSEAFKERAKRLLKRCRFEEAAKVFKELILALQLQRASSKDYRHDASLMQEVGALEGLAVCLSRQLDDAGAEAAQRQALALRSRQWEGASIDGDESCGRVLALKRAALSCLLNLASFVSNQGRLLDAEAILRTVLRTLAHHQAYVRRSGAPFPPSETASSANGNPALVRKESADPPESTADSAVENKDHVSSASPAPPPTTDVPPTVGLSGSSMVSGGSGVGEGLLQGGNPSPSIFDVDGDLEDVDVDFGEDAKERDPEEMAAITRHQLAVVIHSQGRVQEAEQLLEESVAILKQRRPPPQVVLVSQALHYLAGVVQPRDPARACSLYREALTLLEDAKGVDHFLTAPTLAKLGSLLGDSIVAAAAIPPAPAAPAGPGAAGIARSAGLAEAVCAPGESRRVPGSLTAASVEVAAGPYWDAKVAEDMIKRAIVIQGKKLGLRHPALASSLRYAAELYRKQGRLSEAEPLFRKAIGIWEASGGPMYADAVSALHGMAHCVLAGAGADWLGRFEEAFALADQAYRIASTLPGSDVDGSHSSSRLLLEALRVIRSRQRQGRGEPQPASAAIMDGVWNGRWDPIKTHSEPEDGCEMSDDGFAANGNDTNHSRGDDPRCAVCLEEIGVGGNDSSSSSSSTSVSGVHEDSTVVCDGKDGDEEAWLQVEEVKADIGSEEAVRAETEDTCARGRFVYLPCGHRFHIHCISRWLVYSSSCPSCRSRVQDDAPSASSRSPSAPSRTVSSPDTPPRVVRGNAGGGDAVIASPLDNASRSRINGGVDDRPLSPGTGEDGPAPFC